MSKYIPFTTEQKERAASVDLEEFLRRRGEKLITSGRDKRLASDHSITIRGCEWFDHATEQGGRAISFVKQFYGLSYPDAMSLLLGDDLGGSYPAAKEKEPEPAKPFVLPPQSESMRRVYAYLLKQRCIDREILNAFVRKKLIYESCEKSRDGTKEYHNAVFVGFDEHGVPRHAHKRGVYTHGKSYRGNVSGCDPRYSFHWTGSSDRLYVFEAPIDLLSFLTLYPQDWQKHSYVALCGTSEHAMLWMLEQNPQIRKVALCLDHDEAGIEASGQHEDTLRERGIAAAPLRSQYKDWNADLKALHGLPAEPAEEHPQLLAADPICQRIGAAVSSGVAKPEQAEQKLPILLQDYKNHLHQGRFDRAMDAMELAAAMALSSALREFRQMGKVVSPQQGAERLRQSILISNMRWPPGCPSYVRIPRATSSATTPASPESAMAIKRPSSIFATQPAQMETICSTSSTNTWTFTKQSRITSLQRPRRRNTPRSLPRPSSTPAAATAPSMGKTLFSTTVPRDF